MNNHTHNRRSRRGSALLVVIGLIAVISSLLAIMSASGVQRAFTARKLSDRVRALLYAEAGAHEAYSVIEADWSARTNAALFPEVDYGYGTYDVTITDTTNRIAIVHSKGICNGTEVNVVLDIANYGPEGSTTPTGPAPGSAWECTIYSDEEIYLNGNGDVDGKIHGNDQVRCNGNLEITPGPIDISSSTEIRINGNALTPGDLTAPKIRITGNNDAPIGVNKEAVPMIPFPELDLTPFYNTAVENGQVKSGGNYNNDISWKNTPGGVIWIQGDVRFKGNFESDCVVISTGAIRIDGNANWDTAAGDAGSIISRDSTIKINGNVECDALLYAPSTVTLGGNVRLEGQIIAGGDVYINGNVDVINYTYTNPTDSGEIVTPGQDLIGVSAWQG
jgi:cytoskeletal protein CcmA (bactofilin family)